MSRSENVDLDIFLGCSESLSSYTAPLGIVVRWEIFCLVTTGRGRILGSLLSSVDTQGCGLLVSAGWIWEVRPSTHGFVDSRIRVVLFLRA
jgi:hypothetical protein